MKIREIENRILEISLLEDNWDGYNGSKAGDIVLVNTNALVEVLLGTEYLNFLDDIYPNPNGTISMEFIEDTKKVNLEIGSKTFSGYNIESTRDIKVFDGLDFYNLLKINELFSIFEK